MKKEIEIYGFTFECKVKNCSIYVNLVDRPAEGSDVDAENYSWDAAEEISDLEADQFTLVESGSGEYIFHII